MIRLNSCACCGQAFDLAEEDFSEYKSVSWPGLGDICSRCYLDMLDESREQGGE